MRDMSFNEPIEVKKLFVTLVFIVQLSEFLFISRANSVISIFFCFTYHMTFNVGIIDEEINQSLTFSKQTNPNENFICAIHTDSTRFTILTL